MRPPLRIRSYIRPRAFRLNELAVGKLSRLLPRTPRLYGTEFPHATALRIGVAAPSNHLTADSSAFYDVGESVFTKYARRNMAEQELMRKRFLRFPSTPRCDLARTKSE